VYSGEFGRSGRLEEEGDVLDVAGQLLKVVRASSTSRGSRVILVVFSETLIDAPDVNLLLAFACKLEVICRHFGRSFPSATLT
jgi:hypothetical protein